MCQRIHWLWSLHLGIDSWNCWSHNTYLANTLPSKYMLDHLLSHGDITGNKTISWLSYGTFFWNDTVMFERTNINIYKVLGPRLLNSRLLCCCPSFVDRARCLLFTKSQQRRIKTNPGLYSSPKPNFYFQWWEAFLFNGLYYFLSKEVFLRAYCFELLNTRWFIEDYVAEINLVKKKKKTKRAKN